MGRDQTAARQIEILNEGLAAQRAFHIAQYHYEQKRCEESCALFSHVESSLAKATQEARAATWSTLGDPTATLESFWKLATRNKLLSRANGILKREAEEE